jgi:TetR/AcrR family transcriptional regulator
MKKDTSTEEKIKEAAKTVFLAKGFEGCTSREIANAAGMNVALVNYYFRSKSQLFKLIFQSAVEDFMLSLVHVFKTEQALEDKMRYFIEKEYEFLAKHQELPNFIINEMNREEGCSIEHNHLFQQVAETGIFNDCIKEQAAGRMREISLLSMILLIMSNCHYPTMSKKLMQSIHQISEEEYAVQLFSHRSHVTEMIVAYLFPKNSINTK